MGLKVKKTPEGKAYLHVWREGAEYERQKGPLFRKDWTNIKFDVSPCHCAKDSCECIYDVRRSLPFPDETFDAVYTNHVLEHLIPNEGRRFAAEVHRILKPGGIFRISVPDLESACIEYLKCLETCRSDMSEKNIQRYNWSVLELIDQMVRSRPGGLMLEVLASGDFDADYLTYRTGDVFHDFLQSKDEEETKRGKGFIEKVRSKDFRDLLCVILRSGKMIVSGFKIYSNMRDPRKTTEANRWFYDRLSLRLLLKRQGYGGISVKCFADSEIENWARYNFDKSVYGEYPFEPSVYVEGRKTQM